MLAPFVPSVSPKNQADARTIAWSRLGCTGSIPITLYHSVFRRFMDDCKLCPAHPTDNAFALDLSVGMSRTFADGEARATESRDIFQRNGIYLSKSTINSKGAECITDVDIQVNGNRIVILTVRNELCGSDSEPYGESILSYMHSTWPATERSTMFNFPCLIITLFGAHISFSGAVWTDRPQCQILSTLPLFYHQTDQDMHIALARRLGALRKAINSLTQCYLSASPSALPLNYPKDYSDPCFPDQHQYQSLDSDMPSVVRYHYLRWHHSNKLVFVATIVDTGEEICVKFVHQYSRTVHKKCASMGIAPRLRGFENIGGGWKMVVMACLLLNGTSPFSAELDDKSLVFIKIFGKRANLVHEDVREKNVLVRANGDASYVLIDFDWAGIVGEARYPINVPKGKDLWRPDDAVDGELIMPEHDIVMLDHLCSMHPHGW
ncbi:hypothetical protein BDN70DRAFT_968516 [Pholiota conissans]|uniref:Uncharacterized protein n=1 Tax=Pholiota conissans TaxID=109636 RepID=A0A9P5YQB5_9AGAR|nr:hypothetical protein BDN70DRAFT_968516 [Pholiota conissans]